ncbi:MAG: hypothetical protein C4532_04070 [Candidatus Abyssobacteria bacterium SURF_17]|jgi:arylsulfatase A-like enzyme|uniref:Sulfatase N-terminal domain-containing protein n=1 Tax=Candidatus Abyssobacteria bacterium SURF_17 TaxID=2093361 RepID=A0A419F5M0_9BACT|nr:MAG: hypothetical protein C4532_04070 [Candidatus Abyssubacteria bacterium SURF_17]
MRSKKTILIGSALLVSLMLVAAVFLVFRGTRERPSAERTSYPDIILVSIDTLRADHLGCYGYARDTSPSIDAFAEDAVLFEDANAPAPYTAPSHMSIFTGLSPIIHHVYNYRADGSYQRLNERIVTLAEVLQKGGFATVGFVGGAQVSGHLGFDKGFDIYSSKSIIWENVYDNPKELTHVREAIRLSKRESQPLFLFLHHYLCHDPYVSAPKELRLQFMEERVEGLPLGPESTNPDDSAARQRVIWEEMDFTDPGNQVLFRKSREDFWRGVNMSIPTHRRHVMALYDGCISYSDYVFGEILKILKEEDIYNDAIIILLSDHGEEFYEHQTYRHGRLFVETIHVPLIIKFPKEEYRGARIRAAVRALDLKPTLLDILGIETGHFIQGMSFMPLLNGTGSYAPDITSYNEPRIVRVRKDNYVYTNQSCPAGHEWLFDLSTDPRESRNLIGARPDIAAAMRAMGVSLMADEERTAERYAQQGGTGIERDKEVLEQLKALGYLGD